MGLATGEVVVGTVGAPTAKSFAAIGDITNLASRLEGVNKVYGTSVILAEETYRLAQTVVEARELDTVVVAGKSEPVRGDGPATVLRDRCTIFAATPPAPDWDGVWHLAEK